MGEGVFIEMVYVGYAEVQWGHKNEDGLGSKGPNQEMQRE